MNATLIKFIKLTMPHSETVRMKQSWLKDNALQRIQGELIYPAAFFG